MTNPTLDASVVADGIDLDASIRSVALLAGTDLAGARAKADELFTLAGRPLVLGELLALAREVGLLSAFRERARDHVTTKTRPWPGTGYERAGDDPHVLRRFGRFAALGSALDELFAVALCSVDRDAPTAQVDVGVARALAGEIGGSEISGIIELLGASAGSEKHGFHLFWLGFHYHRLAHPPAEDALAGLTELSS